MATQSDVRRIALALPGTVEGADDFRFFVDGKQYLWLWQERVDPKKGRVPNPEVLVARVANDIDKQVLLSMDREVFFTEPHYDGYNAVLIRLPKITLATLKEVIAQAWSSRASGASSSRSGAPKRSASQAPRRRPASGARPSRPARRRRA